MNDAAPKRIAGVGVTEIVAGGLCVLVGAATMVEALSYAMGAARRMGPGWFPFALGLIMFLLGLGIVFVEGILTPARSSGSPALRSLIGVMAAIFAFALLIERNGLAPAVFVATFLATLAEREVRFVPSLVLAIGVTVVTALIFHFGLALPIPLWDI